MADIDIAGTRGKIVVRRWLPAPVGEEATAPRYVVLLAHGYGEHSGRYEHVAAALTADGAAVYAPDHYGHGRSAGDRAVVDNIDGMASDLGRVADVAEREHGEIPLILVGHSLGGMIATRALQNHNVRPAAVVLSGPLVGGNPDLLALATKDPIPEIPLDTEALSRDPAVGAAYIADPLVFHGPWHKKTLMEIGATVERIAAGGDFGDLPTLWLHGAADTLVPYDVTKKAMKRLKGAVFAEKKYAGAKHEILNETNKDEVIADLLAFISAIVPA